MNSNELFNCRECEEFFYKSLKPCFPSIQLGRVLLNRAIYLTFTLLLKEYPRSLLKGKLNELVRISNNN